MPNRSLLIKLLFAACSLIVVSTFAMSPLQAATSTNLQFSGIGRNLSFDIPFSVQISMTIDEAGNVSGYLDADGLPDNWTICGAGDLSGTLQGEKLEFTFVSEDPDPGCGFDHGLDFSIVGTLSADKKILDVRYTVANGQQGVMWAEAVADPSCIAPNGLNTCELQPGDILIYRSDGLFTGFIETVGNSYYTHVGIYSGNGQVIEAPGRNTVVIERALSEGSWLDLALLDWAVLRPNTSTEVKQAAIAYAREMAARQVPYDIAADKTSQERVYCSSLVWQAYYTSGYDIEVVDTNYLSDHITPQEIYASSAGWTNRTEVVQSWFGSDRWRGWTIVLELPTLDRTIDQLSADDMVHMMLTDSSGRRTGYDPDSGSVVNEIPGVYYSGPSSADRETLTITTLPTAESTTWTLEIHGVGDGSYQVSVDVVGGLTQNTRYRWFEGQTSTGSREEFAFVDPALNHPVDFLYLPSVLNVATD